MTSFNPEIAIKALVQMRVRRRPFVLSHGINARCNLRCPFCEYWRTPGREMTADEVFAVLHRLADTVREVLAAALPALPLAETP